jgi:hypothetical protein
LRRAAAVTLLVTVLAGCASTIDSSLAPPPDSLDGSAPPTTTFAATGTTAELLDQLLADASALSEAVIDGSGHDELIARVDARWEAARPGIEEIASARVLRQFDAAIAMLHTAAERRRPADADKGAINLRTLIASLG